MHGGFQLRVAKRAFVALADVLAIITPLRTASARHQRAVSPARTLQTDLAPMPYTLPSIANSYAQDNAPAIACLPHHSPAYTRSNAEAYGDEREMEA